MSYRGRIAPSPTGFLHLGHAATFLTAWKRARDAGGTVIMRVEDLDRARCKEEFRSAIFRDLKWFGLDWDEGPDMGGPHAPYEQCARIDLYRQTFNVLRKKNLIYPCYCSRREIQAALSAPHEGDEEPVYPGTCRTANHTISSPSPPEEINWRFRVPDGELLYFKDAHLGGKSALCGRDFGDFLVWRRDGFPSYQLAVVADDVEMGITEVVRGSDLLISTFRQLLLYRALEKKPPTFYHCNLVRDDAGRRLAKRHHSLSLRALREAGHTANDLHQQVTRIQPLDSSVGHS